jgi:hypothetical protein
VILRKTSRIASGGTQKDFPAILLPDSLAAQEHNPVEKLWSMKKAAFLGSGRPLLSKM